MKYITQSKLAAYRNKHHPLHCPVTRRSDVTWNVDHSHPEQGGNGMIRGNLSSEANMMLGKIEGFYHTYCSGRVAVSLPDMLRNMATYLDKKTTDILHPEGAKSLVTAFKYKKKQDQLDILSGLRQSGRISRTEDVCLCKNSEERTKLYETAIKKEKY